MTKPDPDHDRMVALLAEHRVLHLATADAEGPHAAPLFYALLRGGPTLVWASAPGSRHSLALAQDPRAAASVSPSTPSVALIEGVQLRGRAADPEARQAELAAAYLARFPFAAPMLLPGAGHRLWVLEPTWARLIRTVAGIKRNREWELGQPESA